jgi:hypothetical protein
VFKKFKYLNFLSNFSMETSGFEDQMFSEFSSDSVLNPMGPKAIQQHHFVTSHHHPIIIGSINGQHQRLPDVHQILPGNSPKIDHYKNIDYGHVKIESSPYSPNGKIEYHNGTSKLESYPSSAGPKLEYISNSQFSPNSKIMEYTTHVEQMQLFSPSQSLDGHSQQSIINGTDGNFKRKSNENLNNLTASPTPSTINSISTEDSNTSISVNKKPLEKKKNDPNGVKKKKTRYENFVRLFRILLKLNITIHMATKKLCSIKDY